MYIKSVWLLPEVILISFRSIFKPFIFVDDVKLVPKVQSPSFGDDDPAKKIPRFQEKPDRRHELYKAHEWARSLLESDQVRTVGPWEFYNLVESSLNLSADNGLVWDRAPQRFYTPLSFLKTVLMWI